jgi:hypothetical protein
VCVYVVCVCVCVCVCVYYMRGRKEREREERRCSGGSWLVIYLCTQTYTRTHTHRYTEHEFDHEFIEELSKAIYLFIKQQRKPPSLTEISDYVRTSGVSKVWVCVYVCVCV